MALLFYAHCRGIFSSRKIMQVCEERLTFRVIVGDDIPNWRTIGDFRKLHLKELEGLFVQILHKQYNFTDPESKIMKVSNKGWDQCVNAQAALDSDNQIIVACDVTNQANDKQQFEPMLQKAQENVGEDKRIKAASADSKRKSIVEPVFGQIKRPRGFVQFSLRGLAKMRGEWAIVCLTHNLLKLFAAGYAVAA
jgi:hypothetical protein